MTYNKEMAEVAAVYLKALCAPRTDFSGTDIGATVETLLSEEMVHAALALEGVKALSKQAGMSGTHTFDNLLNEEMASFARVVYKMLRGSSYEEATEED